jgi:hypothetical protein
MRSYPRLAEHGLPGGLHQQNQLRATAHGVPTADGKDGLVRGY